MEHKLITKHFTMRIETRCINDSTGLERWFMLQPNQIPPDGWVIKPSEHDMKDLFNHSSYGISRESPSR